ncbi:Fusaric acid resistance protein-like [Mucilaginibacter lappiensis]|uniref:Membrane protein YccC n=1 Tax=Mucilaginibacter lappiensis TaxID=354630 RepID=A0ABR6PD90_9SPHI|nr:FUSC family protein [Mucilaginibacter lappiensis]MBB6107578.1 putative membrane protein YccC [Mucilaginibacter lappiensis]SIQ03810.1 Fusaric acid resistance protein-like [Mucilaginibacter lappiensis]
MNISKNRLIISAKPVGRFLMDSCRWSAPEVFPLHQILSSMLGFTLPLVIGIITGHVPISLAVAFGGLALSSNTGETSRRQLQDGLYTLIAGSLAVFTGASVAGNGLWSFFIIPFIVAFAGLVGGINRIMAWATTQFIVFTIIATNFSVHKASPLAITILFLIGGIYTITLSLILRTLFKPVSPIGEASRSKYTAKQVLTRWCKSLVHFSGWLYPARIFTCLIIAEIFEQIYPHHHGYWVLLTVAILVKRKNDTMTLQIFQRAAGTVLGVIVADIVLLWSPSVWFTVAIIAVIAGARPILKQAHYISYSTAMVPLVILLSGFGKDLPGDVISDRIITTFIGCFLSLTLGYWFWIKHSLKEQYLISNKHSQRLLE